MFFMARQWKILLTSVKGMTLAIRSRGYGELTSFALLTERSSSKIGSCLVSTTCLTGGRNSLDVEAGAFGERLGVYADTFFDLSGDT